MRHMRRPAEKLPAKNRGIVLVSVTIIMILGVCGCICSATHSSTQSADVYSDPREVLHQAETRTATGAAGPALSENLTSATVVLTRPPDNDRVPYTGRNFSSPVEASIAWWKAPDFIDNTSEFRRYQRAPDEEKAKFPDDKQIFFNFIQNSLDTAENQSSIGSDIILFRGIGSSFAGTVLNNSEYREAAFASTSYDPVVCLDVFGPPDAEGYHSLLVMERTAGDHVLFVNEDEREYLIPRGSDWLVVKSVAIENLTIEADFSLYNRTDMRDSFGKVRLIYITPMVRAEE